MINFSQETIEQLITLKEDKNVFLEGNLLRLIETDNEEFSKYIEECIVHDKDVRRKRLEVTRQVQQQNRELLNLNDENQRILEELQMTLTEVEESKKQVEQAKTEALNDLDLLQKKKQTELIGGIVKVALGVITFIAIMSTGLYVFAIIMGKETTNIGQAWNNLFGILLTNAFSIVGTIMGVKYANKGKN